MTKLAPEWVRTSDPVIRSPARYRWTTAPALYNRGSVRAMQSTFYITPGMFSIKNLQLYVHRTVMDR